MRLHQTIAYVIQPAPDAPIHDPGAELEHDAANDLGLDLVFDFHRLADHPAEAVGHPLELGFVDRVGRADLRRHDSPVVANQFVEPIRDGVELGRPLLVDQEVKESKRQVGQPARKSPVQDAALDLGGDMRRL